MHGLLNKDNAKGSRAFYRDFPFVMDRHHIAIIPNQNQVCPKYLQKYLNLFLKRKNYGWGTNVASVNELQNHSVHLPKPFNQYSSLEIQKAILDFVHFYENDHKGSLEMTRKVTEPATEMSRLIVPLIFQKHYTVDSYFDEYCSRKGIDLKFEEVEFDYPVLDEVFDTVRRGASPRPIKKYIIPENYTGEKYNWLKIGDVTSSGKYLNETKKFINADGKDKSVLGKKGDFLITNSMTIGVPIILNIPVCFHDGFLYLGFDNNEQTNYNKDYLYYFFEYNRHRLKHLSKSGVVNNLNTEIVKEVKIPIPKPVNSELTSYKLQEIIVDFIEDFKQNHQAKIDHYQNIQDRISDVVHSIFKHAFSPL